MKENSMNKAKIRNLATILNSSKTVRFTHNNFFYEILKSADTGYVVNIYSSNELDEYGEYLEENCIDGGLCTGNTENAIEFML